MVVYASTFRGFPENWKASEIRTGGAPLNNTSAGPNQEPSPCATRTELHHPQPWKVALNAASFPREEMESIFALYRMNWRACLKQGTHIFGHLSLLLPSWDSAGNGARSDRRRSADSGPFRIPADDDWSQPVIRAEAADRPRPTAIAAPYLCRALQLLHDPGALHWFSNFDLLRPEDRNSGLYRT